MIKTGRRHLQFRMPGPYHQGFDLFVKFFILKEIELTQGKTALVDDFDYDNLIKHDWQALAEDTMCPLATWCHAESKWIAPCTNMILTVKCAEMCRNVQKFVKARNLKRRNLKRRRNKRGL